MYTSVKKPIYMIVMFGVFILVGYFISCKKDSSDIKDLYAYTAPGNAGYNVLSGSVITLIKDKVGSSLNTSFPVLLTRAFDKNVEVSAGIDTSLVKVYDSLFHTATPSLVPSLDAFGLSNGGKVTIDAGKTSSQDSLNIYIKDVSKLKPGANLYIIPVVLNSATNGIPTSNTRQVMYVKLQVVPITLGLTSTTGDSIINISLNYKNGVVTGQDIAYIVGTLNKPINVNMPINVITDPNLVKSFNQVNGTNYQAAPSGTYQLVNSGLSIPANAIVSKDSAIVKLSNLSSFKLNNDYLLPVRIAQGNGDGTLPVSNSYSIVYIHISVEENNIDGSNSQLQGTLIDKSLWSVTDSSNYYDAYYPPSNAIDGNNSTFWISLGLNWLRLDMGKVNTVKGFVITPTVYDDLVQIKVLTSDDGVTWKLNGIYNNPQPVSANPQTKTLKFIIPVTSRYFKFNITSTYYQSYAGMVELNGIQ